MSAGSTTIHSILECTNNQNAYEYWTKKLDTELANKKCLAKVTFTFTFNVNKKKKLLDIILGKQPVETKEFTISNIYGFKILKKSNLINDEAVTPPFLWIHVTEKDKKLFMQNNPVTDKGEPIFSVSSYSDGKFFEIIIMKFSDIVKMQIFWEES